MIHYDLNKWWGLSPCLQLYGSVLPKAVPYVVLSVVICAVMLAIDQTTLNTAAGESPSEGALLRTYLLHPYAHQIASVMTGFIMVFRVQLSYSRYWEGITVLYDMWTKWYDAAVQVCAFDELSTGEQAKSGPAFRQHALHVFSLMSACTLIELKHADLRLLSRSAKRPPRRPPASRLERLMRGVVSPVGSESTPPIEVVGGFVDDETAHLARHAPEYVDCLLARITRMLAVRFKEGGLNMPPPIVRRVFSHSVGLSSRASPATPNCAPTQ